MKLELNTLFPVDWGKDYFTIKSHRKQEFAPCLACDNTGKVTIKGEEYTCPRCRGNWREKEIIGYVDVYKLQKRRLSSVTFRASGLDQCAELRFALVDNESRFSEEFLIREPEFSTMTSSSMFSKTCNRLYNDRKTALAEVKRLNAESRNKKTGENDDDYEL